MVDLYRLHHSLARPQHFRRRTLPALYGVQRDSTAHWPSSHAIINLGVAAREFGKDGVAPSRVAVAPATAPLGAVVNVAAALYHAPEHASTEFHSILEAVVVVLELVHCPGGDERVGLDNAGSGFSDDVNDGQITQLVSENGLHHPHERLVQVLIFQPKERYNCKQQGAASVLSQFVLQNVARRGDMDSPGRKWHTPQDLYVFNDTCGSQGDVEQQLVVHLVNAAELRVCQIAGPSNYKVEAGHIIQLMAVA